MKIECHVCGTEEDYPSCCGKPMKYKDFSWICGHCGKTIKEELAKDDIPICCEKKMEWK